jgi:hypothetical protein
MLSVPAWVTVVERDSGRVSASGGRSRQEYSCRGIVLPTIVLPSSFLWPFGLSGQLSHHFAPNRSSGLKVSRPPTKVGRDLPEESAER